MINSNNTGDRIDIELVDIKTNNIMYASTVDPVLEVSVVPKAMARLGGAT